MLRQQMRRLEMNVVNRKIEVAERNIIERNISNINEQQRASREGEPTSRVGEATSKDGESASQNIGDQTRKGYTS